MPAFVLVSGHLARRFDGSRRQISRLLSGIVVPYLIFQLIHAALRPLLLDEAFSFGFVRPAWTLWFLMALVIWRLTTPIMRALKFPIVTALFISLVAPMEANLNQDWSMARVLGFLPFYVIGVTLEPHHIHWLRRRVRPWMGYIVLGAALLAAYIVQPNQKASLFFFDASYSDMGATPIRGIVIRAVLLCIGLIGTLGVLAIASGKQNRLTRLGQYSLFIYLLHAIVLFPIRELDLLDWLHSPLHMAIVVLCALILAVALASPPVVWLSQWLVSPDWPNKLLKKSAPDSNGNDAQSTASPTSAPSD